MKTHRKGHQCSYRAIALSVLLSNPISTTCFQSSTVPRSQAFLTYRGHQYENNTARTNSRLSVINEKNLPDYGKTPVEIDQIELPAISKKWIREDLFGKTLVSETLENLESDEEFQETSKRLSEIGAAAMSREERTQRRRALEDLGVPDFLTVVCEKKHEQEESYSPISKFMHRKSPTLLQVNIGLYCNQACGHCHVESSPLKTEEQMTSETIVQILTLLKNTPSIKTLDITGGAPELNANFRMLVSMARDLRPTPQDLEIIDRCNLTVLQEPGQVDLVAFLARQKVRVVASLPCYSPENVDKQRGSGVFDRSISALLAFNQMGYGMEGSSDLKLDLVYNPLGAFLPPEQKMLEAKYKVCLLVPLIFEYSFKALQK